METNVESRPSRLRWFLVAGLGLVVVGLALAAVAFVRWRDDNSRRREQTATVTTCFRWESLREQRAVGPLDPVEVRTRVSDMAIGAKDARPDVRTAAERLRDELVARTDAPATAAMDAMAAVCVDLG